MFLHVIFGFSQFNTIFEINVVHFFFWNPQALDPFDALLKDRNHSAAESSTSKEAGTGANLDDDDDDHNADNVDGDVTHDDEEHAGIRSSIHGEIS